MCNSTRILRVTRIIVFTLSDYALCCHKSLSVLLSTQFSWRHILPKGLTQTVNISWLVLGKNLVWISAEIPTKFPEVFFFPFFLPLHKYSEMMPHIIARRLRGIVIFEWGLKIWDVTGWTGLIWLRMRTSGGLLWE